MDRAAAFKIEVLKTRELGPSEWAAWDSFVAASPSLSSPFFQSDYARISGEIAPGAQVAVVHQGGVVQGFLPIQKRGREIQPLGAPLTDYHGPILSPGTRIHLPSVVRAVGARAFRFTGLVADADPECRATARTTLVADLSGGYATYEQAQRATWKKYFRDKERAARSLERDHGQVEYSLNDPGALDWLIARKRQQYRATGQHDIFRCGWTDQLLRSLLDGTDALQGRIATMRLRGELIAAEYSLLGGRRFHFWFPAFSANYRRYSPGVLLTLQTLRLSAAEGLLSADFGLDEEPYKKHFAQPTACVFEGVVPTPGPSLDITAYLPPQVAGRMTRLQRKASRRWGTIRACEPHWQDVAYGAVKAVADASLRRFPWRTRPSRL